MLGSQPKYGVLERGGVQHAHSRLPLSLKKKMTLKTTPFLSLFYFSKKRNLSDLFAQRTPPIFLPPCMSVPFLSIAGHASSLRQKTKGLSLPHLLLLQQNLLLLLLLSSTLWAPNQEKNETEQRSSIVYRDLANLRNSVV